MTKTNKTPTYLGAAFGFVVFLVVGALPGILYGGYLGLFMASALLGSPNELTILSRVMTGGGMVLGFLASLFLFLVAGGVLGSAVGAALEAASGATAQAGEPTNEAAAQKRT